MTFRDFVSWFAVEYALPAIFFTILAIALLYIALGIIWLFTIAVATILEVRSQSKVQRAHRVLDEFERKHGDTL